MFLLHFPYSYLRRTLSGILALRSPDFPHTEVRDRQVYPCIVLFYIFSAFKYEVSVKIYFFL